MTLWQRIKDFAAVANVRKRVTPAATPALKPIPVGNAAVIPAREEKPPAPPAAPPIVPAREVFDRAAFFARLREGPLRHRDAEQVRGTEAILDAMTGSPVAWVAYALATAWHETGGKMKPNTESLNYSVSGLLNTFQRHRISRADADRLGRKPGEGPLPLARQRAIANILYGGEWGRDNLGNTEPDDGWTYRGRGLDHCTGRRNYRTTGEAIGVDLLANPEGLLDLGNAVRALVTGMKTGRYVPGHTLMRYLPTIGEATAAQFGNARQIINGRDRQGEIAANALLFQRALEAGGWQ